MEENGHVVLVVGSIEPSNIDQRIALTVAEILGVEGRFSIVLKPYEIAVAVCVLNPLARIFG